MTTAAAIQDDITRWGRFYAKARAVAAERGITKDAEITVIAYDLRRAAFLEAIEPYARKKAKYLELRTVRMVINARPGEPPGITYESNPDIDQAVAMCDDIIAWLAKEYGQLP